MRSNSLVFGLDEEHPLIEISIPPTETNKEYKKIPVLEGFSNIASVVAQAAPALMTAKELAGKNIMEVVIHGNLAKAADGNGLRAFSKSTNGKFIEHARLYHADSLSNIVNTAAVWQIASIVVAQKHLADINKKLEDLHDGVNRINDFLQVERTTRIQAIYESLKEKTEALAHTKQEQVVNIINSSILSKYDDDLKQIYLHVRADFEKYGTEKVEHKETFGTADLKIDIENKINELEKLAELAFLCLNLRLLCCNLMGYLGGLEHLKDLIQQKIMEELENLKILSSHIKDGIETEINTMSSWVNSAQKTINNNKGKIVAVASVGVLPIAAGSIIISSVFSTATSIAATASMFKKPTNKSGILEQRKEELRNKLGKLNDKSITRYNFTKKLSVEGVQSLLEKEAPIKLAFQRLDAKHLICLNTGEKIKV